MMPAVQKIPNRPRRPIVEEMHHAAAALLRAVDRAVLRQRETVGAPAPVAPEVGFSARRVVAHDALLGDRAVEHPGAVPQQAAGTSLVRPGHQLEIPGHMSLSPYGYREGMPATLKRVRTTDPMLVMYMDFQSSSPHEKLVG